MIDEVFEQRLRRALYADACRAPLQPAVPPRPTGAGRMKGAGRPGWLPRWAGPVAAGVTAAAVAAAVVAYGTASPPRADAVTASMLSYRPAGAPAVGALLPALAARAARQPLRTPPPGGYLYQATETWYLAVAVSADAVTSQVIPKLEQSWSTSAGDIRRQTQQNATPVAPGPLSQSEEAAARREATYGPVTAEPALPAAENPLRALNSSSLSPQALFRELADNGITTTALPDPQLSNQVDVAYALQNLVAYLQYTPPSPRLLASVYRMIALIPGVSDAGWVRDRAGRQGLAISVPVDGPGHEFSWRLIADPGSGGLLDAEDIQVDPSGIKIRTPFVFSYTLFLRSQVTPILQRP
jgi:hypothetical protein